MLVGARVEGEPRPFDLAWSAPQGCPAAADVREAVERYVGRPLSTEPIAARATVTREKTERWRLSLRTTFRGDTRERVIEGDSCGAVADAAALVLAFLIDPNSVEASAPSVSPSLPSDRSTIASLPEAPVASARAEAPVFQPATKSPIVDSPPPTTPTSQPAPARRWTLRATAGADSSSLPSWTGFVGVDVARAFGRGSLELSGAYYAPRSREISQGRGGTFDLLTLGARGCYAAFGPTFEVSPCVGAEYGTVRGTGFGVGDPGAGKGLWLAATMAGAARWRMTPGLGTMAEVGITLPLVRPDYVIDNVGFVYRTDFVGLRLLAGLESYF
jgi:hypothetical protein